MAVQTERPNYLLIWIGVLILIFTVALRGLVPTSLTVAGPEAGGAVVPVIETPEPILPAVLDPALLVVPPALIEDTNVLVEGSHTEPGFMRVDREELGPQQTGGAWTAVASTASPVHHLPAEPSRLERLEPASFERGIAPRPSRSEPARTSDRPSRTADASVGTRAVLVSFHGTGPAEPELQGEPEPVEQALILEIAPDTFRAIVVVEDVAVKGFTVPAEEPTAAEAAPEEEEAPAPDRGSQKLAFLAELRQWLESHDGRAELGPESLRRLQQALEREGLFADSGLRDRRGVRRLLVLDLDRAELDRLLVRLAERVQSRAESN